MKRFFLKTSGMPIPGAQFDLIGWSAKSNRRKKAELIDGGEGGGWRKGKLYRKHTN